MRAVIGTAGHVDHGKTALIKALTGMMTARAHEQACGMTLDLGFAHFDDGDGNTIGVIDVPGHERFIRNMVAGVWSLDLVLLVVAADEGWMPMSTDHLNVAHAMGIRNIILCINKSDAVDEDTLALVEEDALEKCMDITGEIPESMCVSALTGKNIQALRHLISRQLKSVERKPLSHSSHLYIDRVFTVNGIGTVVTGSLADGSIKVGDKLKLYPAGKDVQVRTLQSYHKNLSKAHPVSRVAVGLKGVSRKELDRGCCLTTRDAACAVTDQLFVRLDIASEAIHDNRKNREVEVAIGTWHGLGQLVHIRGTRLARLKLSSPAPVFWSQSLAMIRHGGSDLIHSGHVVWSGDIAMHMRKRLHPLLSELPDELEPIDQMKLSLDLYGYAPAQGVNQGEWGNDYLLMDGWLLSKAFHETTLTNILALLEKEGEGIAMTLAEMSTRLSVEGVVLEQLLHALKSDGKVRMSKEAWMAGAGASEDDLGPEAQALLELIRDAGRAGLEAGKAKIPGAQKHLRNLVRLGFLTAFEGKIYYTTDLYATLISEVLDGFEVNSRFSIPEVKERTGLSRKYMIPLLNRMALDGWVRRDDNERIVLKIPDEDKVAA
ncbi:selenocysteine-specific translation elongation factor [Endozoicomonas sp.]|nr:selenocysteine-specific translation elongation factor [Endozoicomonas sp.]